VRGASDPRNRQTKHRQNSEKRRQKEKGMDEKKRHVPDSAHTKKAQITRKLKKKTRQKIKYKNQNLFQLLPGVASARMPALDRGVAPPPMFALIANAFGSLCTGGT